MHPANTFIILKYYNDSVNFLPPDLIKSNTKVHNTSPSTSVLHICIIIQFLSVCFRPRLFQTWGFLSNHDWIK